jgi:two-component system chemotaxis response regulator CheY
VPGGQCEIFEATSGFDALRILPRGRWDLVITDINMPDINGLELLAFVRRSDVHRSTPVILISTQSSEKDRQRGLTLGANAYLVKPFTSEQLATEVQRQIGPASAGSNV